MTKDEEIILLKKQLTVVAAARWFDRFHNVQIAEDKRCLACGGPVELEESDQVQDVEPEGEEWRAQPRTRLPKGVRLKAVRPDEARLEWLESGLQEALRHLQNGSKSLAITAIKGTLA